MATCPTCLSEVPKLTRDHIFPRWLWSKLPLLGARQPAAWTEMICGPCNTEKGGTVNFSDARTREILRHLAVRLIEQCYEAEKDIRDGVTIEREKEKPSPKTRKAYRVAPSGRQFKEPEGTSLAEALRQLEAPEGGHAARATRVRIEDVAPPEVLAEIDREHAKKKKRKRSYSLSGVGRVPKGGAV